MLYPTIWYSTVVQQLVWMKTRDVVFQSGESKMKWYKNARHWWYMHSTAVCRYVKFYIIYFIYLWIFYRIYFTICDLNLNTYLKNDQHGCCGAFNSCVQIFRINDTNPDKMFNMDDQGYQQLVRRESLHLNQITCLFQFDMGYEMGWWWTKKHITIFNNTENKVPPYCSLYQAVLVYKKQWMPAQEWIITLNFGETVTSQVYANLYVRFREITGD